MKKLLTLLLSATVAIGLISCGQSNSAGESNIDIANNKVVEEAKPENITIKSLNGNKEEIEIEVPYDPERIAILDLAALDIIDNLGVGDRVVGTANTSIDYLSSYANNDEIKNLGTIKEADLEAVMACEPDIIFINPRLSASYDAFSEIAPVVFLATDTEIGLVESVTKNATTIASIFGLESSVEEKVDEFADRIKALQEVADGKTALVGMTTSGSFNLLGNDGRCSIIGTEVGFENLTATESSSQKGESSSQGGSKGEGQSNGQGGSNSTSAHGNETSFELVVQQNPDYIFVMDRDSAIGTEGAQLAKEIMENELVMGTDAYKNGNIIYLENPAVWYTAEGGITALDTMLSDLESGLGVK